MRLSPLVLNRLLWPRKELQYVTFLTINLMKRTKILSFFSFMYHMSESGWELTIQRSDEPESVLTGRKFPNAAHGRFSEVYVMSRFIKKLQKNTSTKIIIIKIRPGFCLPGKALLT